MIHLGTDWTRSTLRGRLRIFAAGLLAFVLLPLAGCDSAGPNGDDTDTEIDVEAPEDFEAEVQDDGTVELTWNADDGAETYNVYRSTDSIETTEESPLENGLSATSYTDGSAEEGKAYYYAASSVGPEGTETGLSEEERIETPPASPNEGNGDDSWTRVKTGTDEDINDVALTSEGAYAVADGGILLKRTSDSWTKVLQGGVSSNGNNLLGLGVTEDGDRLWMVGASGRIGEYDVTTGSLQEDHSAPNDVTNNFQDVAVMGDAGAAFVYVAGGSGKVYYSLENGATWNEATPGNGSALRAIDMYATDSGHLIDDNQSVFETTDAGSSWEPIGIADADVSFYGVDSDATDDVWVAAGNGTVYQWNGSDWTSLMIGEATLRDVEVGGDDQTGYTVGGSGTVFTYDGSAGEWSSEKTPTSNNLNAVVLPLNSPAPIAVGDGGTVIER